ncbi:hypothetical protein Tco_1410628 [Tanacetum coccineum]
MENHGGLYGKSTKQKSGCGRSTEWHEISIFMHGITHPELIKRLYEKIPRSIDKMYRVTTSFLQGEVAAFSYSQKKAPASWRQPEEGNKPNFKKGFKNRQRSDRKPDSYGGRLDEMIKSGVAKQRITQSFSPETVISFPSLGEEDGTEGPMIIEAEIGGHFVHRIYVDGGASSEVLYEHCFVRLRPEIRSQMIPATTSLIGFSGETIWPIGQISLLVTYPTTWNKANGIRKIRVVPSTAHGMLKFPVKGGTVTIRSSRVIPMECAMISGPNTQHPVTSQVLEEKIKVAIHPEYPEQTIAIGSTLTEKGRKELCALLRQNLDVFAWRPADMTGVPRHIAEHRLNVREGCLPIRQKKRGQAPERNKAIQEEVEKLVDARIMKEVHYHSWLSNPVMVKKHDGSWRMCVDFKDLNKACPQDGYPLPEIDWKVESLCGYPLKCFLDAYKGAFQKQIGRNLEVYVDDLVIKSHTEEEIIRDIAETFKTLRQINMKLNPKKWAFKMQEGIFLGYKVNADGLKDGEKILKGTTHNCCNYRSADKTTAANSEITGRMLKWKFKLEGYEIQYRPRISIKGKILADFIVKRPEEESPDEPMTEPEELMETLDFVHRWIIMYRWFRSRANTNKPRRG